MNLGGFAGGLAQGYQQQQNFNLQQQEAADNRNFRERQMQMQEAEAAARKKERDEQDAMRKEAAAAFQKHFGPQQVQDGEVETAGPDGAVQRVPKVTTKQVQPGTPEWNKAAAGYAMDHAAIAAKYRPLEPEQMIKIAQGVEEQMQTARGQALMKVLQGDESALSTFVKESGRDPSKAKLDFNPAEGVMQVKFNDGSDPIDLKRAFSAATVAQQARAMGLIKDAQEERKQNLGAAQAEVVTKQAKINLDQDEKMFPIKMEDAQAGVSLKKSTANLHNAQAAAAGEGKRLAIAQREDILDQKRQRDLDARINTSMGKMRDAFSDDGKGEWNTPKLWAQTKATEKLAKNPKANVNDVFSSVMSDYAIVKASAQEKLSLAQSDPAKMQKLVARYKTKNPQAILQGLIEETLQRN